ncbi:hypothetical protein PIB30_055233 [Stylosanthes scabra]|uniref:Uncharacterized protein n=1 Tax=Stylosanthes scabra TaxID=79078 RepID=A0ABU6UI17_9FABA|nr:hypothetical protein [Stylosanthes scabra]
MQCFGPVWEILSRSTIKHGRHCSAVPASPKQAPKASEDYKAFESKMRSITNSPSNNEEKVFDLDKMDQAGNGLAPSSSCGGVE